MALEKRGGKSPGAGRPKGTTKVVHNVRPQHQLRAFEDEWRMISRFARLVKHGRKEECQLFLDGMEEQ